MIKGESSQEVDKASSKLDAVIHWAVCFLKSYNGDQANNLGLGITLATLLRFCIHGRS